MESCGIDNGLLHEKDPHLKQTDIHAYRVRSANRIVYTVICNVHSQKTRC